MPTDQKMARLLKGVEVGRYELHKELQQERREWLDEDRFLRRETPKPVVQKQRIATQRITGVDERLRVVATMMNPPAYFADSTNSVTVSQESLYKLEYLLALFNSRFTQWRFKLTSTNNNVGTNELESLPFRVINFSDACDKSLHDTVVAKVEAFPPLRKRDSVAKSNFLSVQFSDKAGRPDIDAFETAMRRAKREKGFFVSFDYSQEAEQEVTRFWKEENRTIILLTVKDLLDENYARKLA